MSREKIWMQHTTAESVQMMVEKTVKPQTLKRRSWGGAGRAMGAHRAWRGAQLLSKEPSPTLSATRMLRQSGLGNMVSISLCWLQEAGACSR